MVVAQVVELHHSARDGRIQIPMLDLGFFGSESLLHLLLMGIGLHLKVVS